MNQGDQQGVAQVVQQVADVPGIADAGRLLRPRAEQQGLQPAERVRWVRGIQQRHKGPEYRTEINRILRQRMEVERVK